MSCLNDFRNAFDHVQVIGCLRSDNDLLHVLEMDSEATDVYSIKYYIIKILLLIVLVNTNLHVYVISSK